MTSINEIESHKWIQLENDNELEVDTISNAILIFKTLKTI